MRSNGIRKSTSKNVGILGHGEIGSSIARLCEEAGFTVFIRDRHVDNIKGQKIDYLHVNIPERKRSEFIRVVGRTMKELQPKLTVINSSTSVGVTKILANKTGLPVVHSPVIGVHPHLYESIKFHFKKIIGPTNKKSLALAKKHLKALGLKIVVYDNAETSEAAKLLDLVYYAWNIIFAKWMQTASKDLRLNFDQVYTMHNKIYNKGYKKLRPNVIRPILIPQSGPIGGHCTIPDTILLHRYYKNRFTNFILKEQERYLRETLKEQGKSIPDLKKNP